MTDHTAIDTGLLILRVVLGLTMAAHGYNKFFGKGGLAGTAGWFDSMGMKPGMFHARVAANALRTLERDGLIARTDYEENPPRVVYELTELGRSLLEPLRAVRHWAEAHVPAIQAANAAAAGMQPGGR